MNKKLFILSFIFTLFLSGCSGNLSKSEMLEKNKELASQIETTREEYEDFLEAKKIIDFYNTLSSKNMNSMVLVESKNIYSQTKKYSNGVIVGNSGNYFYVLTDYYALNQNNISYTVMDSYATSYSGSVYSVNEELGMMVLSFSIRNIVSYVSSMSVGEYSDICAYVDSIDQLNNVTLIDDVTTSTIEYNDTSYTGYNIENKIANNGAILVNIDNKLMAIYSSKVNAFIDQSLIREIVDFI